MTDQVQISLNQFDWSTNSDYESTNYDYEWYKLTKCVLTIVNPIKADEILTGTKQNLTTKGQNYLTGTDVSWTVRIWICGW